MINELFIWFWTIMIFASIAWYALLLFYVGIKGGREILAMVRTLSARTDLDDATEVEASGDSPSHS